MQLTIDRFTMYGVPLPPIPTHGVPGDVWPASGALRLQGVSRGTPGAHLRVLGFADIATFEARPVVDGVPGAWVDISNTDDFLVTAAEDEEYTFDLRATILARAPKVEVRGWAYLRVVAEASAGL